ncbi:hypothetical protein HK104_008276 [Borealophlyctis nickersoniae]|nr:hypothetical protein HK104_008276 [Borealophlyctis nickersoniae]
MASPQPIQLVDTDPAELEMRQKNMQQVMKEAEAERKRLDAERMAADANEADRLAEAERQRRINEQKLYETQEELLRKRGTQEAIKVRSKHTVSFLDTVRDEKLKNLEEQEQQRRIVEETKSVVESEFLRRRSVQIVNAMEDQERERRTAAQSFDNLPGAEKNMKKIVQETLVQTIHEKHPDEASYTYSSDSRAQDPSLIPRAHQQQQQQQQQQGQQQGQDRPQPQANAAQKVAMR